MDIRLKATKIELTPKIKEYVQEKMDMLDKYVGTFKVQNCDVEVGLAVGNQNSGEIYRAEINLELMPGGMLRVEKTEKDLFKAIDKVKDHMAEMIKKHKEKFMDKKMRA
jgi:putative sigma-54 modulation protein